jgi:phosphatidylglycerol:prolipoprotein diacylglycerol transferase
VIPYKPAPIINMLGLRIGIAPLMSTIGFVVLGYLVAREFRKRNIKLGRNQYITFVFLMAISSLAGGRIWYFASNWQGIGTLRLIFNVFEPGLTSYGMIIGGFAFLHIWVKNNPLKGHTPSGQLAQFADSVLLYTPLFIAIYRVGCIFNGCCLGTRTNAPWGFENIRTHIAVHPSPIYEIISALIIFFLLKTFFGKEKTNSSKFGRRFDGETGLWFLALYGAGRFITDFFRYYQSHYLGLSGSQWVCIFIFAASIATLGRNYHGLRNKKWLVKP